MSREGDHAPGVWACRCGARLSTWNTGARCAACERKGAENAVAPEPPVMPGEFWRSAEFRTAFQNRAMGTVLRLFRTADVHRDHFGPDGITQNLLGTWLGLSQGQISRIEREEATDYPIEKMTEWAEKLSIPNDLLWFALTSSSRFANSVTSATELLAFAIKQLRTKAKLSQRGLAQRSGYTREYISMAERRDTNIPSREVVQALDATLNAKGRLLELHTRAKAEQRALRHSLQKSSDTDSETPAADPRALLGSEIRKARQKAGLSQPQLAKAVGYSRQYMSGAENPNHPLPSAELVQAIDRHLGANNTLIELRKTAHFHAYQARHNLRPDSTPPTGLPLSTEPTATTTEADAEAPETATSPDDKEREPNTKFRAARLSTPSLQWDNECLSMQELAEAANEYLWTKHSTETAINANYISKIERGVIGCPRKHYRDAFRAVLNAKSDSDLGFRSVHRSCEREIVPRLPKMEPESASDDTTTRERRTDLTRARKAKGYTQETFAEAIDVSRTTITRWESGSWEPSPYVRPRIAKALQVSLEELDALITPEKTDEHSEIERRGLLATTGATALEVALTSSPMRTLQALEIVTADSADSLGVAIDCLNELVPHYSNSLATSSPDSIFSDLIQCRHYSSKLLQNGTLPPSKRAELTVNAGWLSNLLAVATSYMGDHGSAVIWCVDAERRGRESGNKEIAAWAAFTRAMIAYYQGDMNRTIEAASNGLQIAPRRSVVRARLSSHAMRAHATQGNEESAISAKGEASKAIAELPASIAQDGVFSIALSEEPPYTATSLLLSGRFKEASAVTRKVLRDAYSNEQPSQPAKSSNHARTLLTLGLSEAGLGNIDEAASAGRSALDSDNLVWPTLVLAGKLNRALRQGRNANSTTVEYHNLYHDALTEYRTLNAVSRP